MSALNILDANKPENGIDKNDINQFENNSSKNEKNEEHEAKDEEMQMSSCHDPEDELSKKDQFQTVKNNCYCQRNKEPSASGNNENDHNENNEEMLVEDLQEDVKNPNIICFTCKSEFHQKCISLFSTWSEPQMMGDAFYWYMCKDCKLATIPQEEREKSDLVLVDELRRLSLTWIDVVTIALLNLTFANHVFTLDDEDNKFYHKNEISDFIESNWNQFWIRSKGMPWKGSVTACLNASTNRFRSLSEGLFALDTLESAHKQCEQPLLNQKRIASFLIAGDGTLVDIEEGKPLRKRRNDVFAGGEIDIFDRVEELDAHGKKKKRSLKFDEENIDPATAIMIYPDIDNPTNEHVCMSDQPTHSAPQVTICSDGLTVSNEKGYRMAKSTHGIWEGHWYFEVSLNNNKGNTRIGWSQISGDLQAPCGYDLFSYSFRNAPGNLFHNSRPVKDAPPPYEGGYKSGDVLGISIYIPKQKKRPRDCAIDEQLLRRLWDPERMDQYVPFKSKPLSAVPKSYIEFFKNGNSLGEAFTNINFGKYHPAISLYGGASASVNFGPDFIFMPLDNAQPFCKVRFLKTWEESIHEHKLMLEQQAAIKKEKLSEKNHAVIDDGKQLKVSAIEPFPSEPIPHSESIATPSDTGEISANSTSKNAIGRPMYSAEEKAKIIAYANTTSQAEASRKFNVHKSMVSRWIIKSKSET